MIKEKYKVQSTKCGINFLYKGIEILTKADYNYKTSNNKRLLTELALIQLCNISGEITISKPSVTTIKEEKRPEKIVEEKKEVIQEEKEEPAKLAVKEKEVPKDELSTISIKNLINDEEKEPENIVKETNENVIEQEIAEKTEEFTFDKLKEVWLAYAGKYEKEERRKYIMLTKQEINLTEGFVVNYKAATSLQKDAFIEIKNELLAHLKNKLSNHKISINIIVEEVKEDNKEKLYTDKDKYEYLKKKNPKLDDLKNNLKLDFQ